MYLSEQSAAHSLHTTAGENLVLQSVNVDVTFHNLLCKTILKQVYRNLEEKPIEAVYTFPLASKAALLGLKVTIGDRELQGTVIEKGSAEERYEEAITDGDTAIMLELLEPGLYTMNIGNILAGEEVSVAITYAELYSWQGDILRFHLPTTISPRYGNPESAGLQPHQVPEYDLLTENRFQLKITISGSLANAEIECPSHKVSVARSNNGSVVTLATGEACMDRDFILNIHSCTVAKDAVVVDRDLDGGFVALASFAPRLPLPDKIPPKSVKIVVDCSGSMGGDSIAQARQAINDILNQLRPEDFFNLIAFGSTCKTYSSQQLRANKENITKVKRLLRSLDADMGGTEMNQALQAAIQIPGPPILHDILLITDGEIWNSEELISTAKKSGHRVFTIGVGSSVSEGFVRQLARETGGACELVTLNENMAGKIVRHFNRIYLPKATDITVRWPFAPNKNIPDNIGPVYDGDTLHVFACFAEKPQGPVMLEMTLADGRTSSQTAIPDNQESAIPVDDLSNTLARMAMYRSLADEDEKVAAELAVRYQLISPHTNYLVVDMRDGKESGHDLPLLRKVRQTVAAGWGGTGSVCLEEYDFPMFCRRKLDEPQESYIIAPNLEQHMGKQKATPASFIKSCNRLHTKLRQTLKIESYDDLADCGLPNRIIDAVKSIAKQKAPLASEKLIVLSFLLALTRSSVGGEFSRKTMRAINKAKKALLLYEQLNKQMTQAFAGISKDDWGPDYPLEQEDN
ncbi:VWA domain-containing protein [Candidatus Bipolaricaulota bacterium]|nr:VWA domain-containing protein [Candidatus Bipolaricaulota bacterium]